MKTSTYITGNHLTVADLVVFADLHSHAQKITVVSTPNVLRWVDLVQNTAVKGNVAAEKEFSLIPVDHENVPEPVITVAVSIMNLRAPGIRYFEKLKRYYVFAEEGEEE